MTDQADMLMPQLEAKLKDTLHEILPFYLQMGKERLTKIRPRLESSLKEQADKLPDQLREVLGKQIDDRFNKITDDATKQLAANFPAIAADSGRHAGEQLRTELTAEGQKLREHVMTLATEEMSKANTTLQKFPVPDVSNTDRRRAGPPAASRPGHAGRLRDPGHRAAALDKPRRSQERHPAGQLTPASRPQPPQVASVHRAIRPVSISELSRPPILEIT